MKQSMVKDIWQNAKGSEVNFWIQFIVKNHNEEFFVNNQLNPNLPFQEELKKYVKAGNQAKILDVGSGPFTLLGRIWDGIKLDITAIDPLADEYNKIFSKLKINVPVKPRKGNVENISELFPENYFDFIYMSNSLDHSYNPLEGLRQLIKVVKQNSIIYLSHWINEAEHNNYYGFHQWNLCFEDNNFIIWTPREKFIVNEEFKDIVEIEIQEQENLRIFNVVLKKL